MKIFGKFLLAIAVMSLAVTSCKKDDPEVTAVSGVKLNKATLTLAPGGTEKLTATVEPEGATEKTVTWTSSDNATATVGEDGTVTAVQVGIATITVTTKDGGKTATCEVTVSDGHIAVTGVKLDKSTLTLNIGGKSTLTATVEPADASNKSISWRSSDSDKVKVSATGAIEALGEGTATITVTTSDGNKTATCAVTVNIPNPGDERQLREASISIFAGGDEAEFADGTGTAARFSAPRGLVLDSEGNLYITDSGNNRIRKVTSSGVVTTVAGNGDRVSEDGPAASAKFFNPYDAAIHNGNLYVIERHARGGANPGGLGGKIRKIDLAGGTVSTFAGGDTYGHVNAQGAAARFNALASIEVDGDGNFYVSDFFNRIIRKITPDGTVSDYAGPLCVDCDYGGDDKDMLSYPGGLCWNPIDGNLYVAALNRERVVKITGVDVYDTFVGHVNADGEAQEIKDDSYKDGPGAIAEFARPAVITADESGYMFLGEQSIIHRIRFITPNGTVSTIAAGAEVPLARTNALLPKLPSSPNGIAVTPDGKTLYVAEGNKIWKIEIEYNNY
jgi:sugar lactone lactonase YvrE